MNIGDLWDWAKANPVLAGLSIVGIGLVLLWLLGYFSRAPQSGDNQQSHDLAAYYAASVAQQRANADITAAQLDRDVQLAAIAANESIYNTQTAAALQLGTTQSNNALSAYSVAATAAEQLAYIDRTGQVIPSGVMMTDPLTGLPVLVWSDRSVTPISPTPSTGGQGLPPDYGWKPPPAA